MRFGGNQKVNVFATRLTTMLIKPPVGIAITVLVAIGIGYAAVQLVPTTLLLVKNPLGNPTARVINWKVTQRASADTVAGNPAVDGATLGIALMPGGEQCIPLPASGWSVIGTVGFKYKDPKLLNGPVRAASIKKTGSGTFQAKASLKGNGITVTPGNPTSSYAVTLSIGGTGDSYCSSTGTAVPKADTAVKFQVNRDTVPATCAALCGPTTSTTTTTELATSTTTSTISTTTTTMSSSTTTTTTIQPSTTTTPSTTTSTSAAPPTTMATSTTTSTAVTTTTVLGTTTTTGATSTTDAPTTTTTVVTTTTSTTTTLSGNAVGDVHMMTFNQLAYDLQAVGEFVLVHSLDDTLAIQTRTAPWTNGRPVSVNRAVAADIAGDRVGVYIDRTPNLYVGGSPIALGAGVLTLPGGGTIQGTTDGYLLTWPDASQLHVGVNSAAGYLDVRAALDLTRRGRVEGLLGSYDGTVESALSTRDHVALPIPLTFDQLYGTYAESWRISQAESLFDYAAGQTTDTFTDRTFPSGFIGVSDIPDADRAQAEQTCTDAGVTDPALFRNCTLDVGLTSDATFAASTAAVTPPQAVAGVPLGESRDTAATSCLAILNGGPQEGNGLYWIALNSGTVQLECDFTSGGGGWTRVGALDGTTAYCTPTITADMRSNPDVSAGKIPDDDARSLMSGTPGSPMEVMYYVRGDNRYVWHSLQGLSDFDTSQRHTSTAFYCTTWHCDDGTTDASACGTEGNGCPVTAMGIPGTTKKIYVDYSSFPHSLGFHSNGTICSLSNYTSAKAWVYVR